MKRFIVIIFASVVFVSCDNPKALRHLFRATNRASQTEQNKQVKSKIDYLISFSHNLDSMGKTVFTANYTLPKDTNLFFRNISLNMPEKLGFDGKVDSCMVHAYFFKSVADTANINYSLKKSFAFFRNNEFYRIKEK